MSTRQYTVGSISCHKNGTDVDVEWRIPNFSTLSSKNDALYYSPLFSFNSEDCYLGIYPNVCGDSAGYVGLFLYKYHGQRFSIWLPDRPVEQSFSLSLKMANGEKHNEQYCTEEFHNIFVTSVGFNRFISRSELIRRRSELVPDDVLTVICTMKSGPAGSESEASASGSSVCPHDSELNRDLKELFLNKEDSDVIIKVKDSDFPAHRLILKARSPVFASTFRHDMKENATGIIEIDDCDPSSFSNFLCYLYCGDATLISQENVFDLFTAADKYQVLDLRAKCLEFLKQNLSVDTFCETLTLALRHSEAELIRLCTDYFKQNVPKIIVTVNWQTFLAENPTESNELLVKSFVPNSS